MVALPAISLRFFVSERLFQFQGASTSVSKVRSASIAEGCFVTFERLGG